MYGDMLAEHRWVLFGHLRRYFGVFVWYLFLCLGLHGRRELNPAGQEHFHPDIKANLVAVFVRWNHVVRYNVPRLWLTINTNERTDYRELMLWITYNGLCCMR